MTELPADLAALVDVFKHGCFWNERDHGWRPNAQSQHPVTDLADPLLAAGNCYYVSEQFLDLLEEGRFDGAKMIWTADSRNWQMTRWDDAPTSHVAVLAGEFFVDWTACQFAGFSRVPFVRFGAPGPYQSSPLQP